MFTEKTLPQPRRCGCARPGLRTKAPPWYACSTLVPPLPALLAVVLFCQLGPVPSDPAAIPIKDYRQEADLLNLPINRKILQSLPLWDAEAGVLRKARRAFDDSDTAPILILHLWATWCAPCREELPIWRKLWNTLYNESSGRVRAVHIAMQNDADGLPKFIDKIGSNNMPIQPLYFDQGGHLAKNLSEAFDDKSMPPLPITIWLDPERIVRRVIVGSIRGRISEVTGTSKRMLKLYDQQVKSGRRPKPKEEDDDTFSTPP